MKFEFPHGTLDIDLPLYDGTVVSLEIGDWALGLTAADRDRLAAMLTLANVQEISGALNVDPERQGYLLVTLRRGGEVELAVYEENNRTGSYVVIPRHACSEVRDALHSFSPTSARSGTMRLRSKERDRRDDVALRLARGLKPRHIAEDLGISLSYTYALISRIRQSENKALTGPDSN